MGPITSTIVELGGWSWLILGGIFLLLELAVPGVFFIWFGAAAAIVGAVALTTGLAWQWQMMMFVILSIAAAFAARNFMRSHSDESDRPLLNKRALQHVGRAYVLDQAIVNGHGKVRIGDSVWLVEGKDLPKGKRVTVTGADGATLLVEPAKSA
jgi:hypothetical protein